MSGPPVAIQASIDLRGVCQEIRDQGARATCLACATSDAHAVFHGCPPLSAEFLFFHAIQIAKVGNLTDGITLDEAAAALAQEGQPAEHVWPYSLTQPSPWSPPTATQLWRGNLGHGTANAAAEVVQFLKAGQPVVLGVRISSAFLSPTGPGFAIPASGPGHGGHAVLVVGLGQDVAGDEYLLIRNSWGPFWGDAGHAWLQIDYLNDKLVGFGSICPHL